jgi:hypothetical protein
MTIPARNSTAASRRRKHKPAVAVTVSNCACTLVYGGGDPKAVPGPERIRQLTRQLMVKKGSSPMSRSARKSFDQEIQNPGTHRHCRHEIGSGRGGSVRFGKSTPQAFSPNGRFHVDQSNVNQQVNPTIQPTRFFTVKGGVADEESFFKRSLQSTLTVNALQVQAVRR